MKKGAPALPDSPTFQQLWDTLGSKLIETAQERLLYTQEVLLMVMMPVSFTLAGQYRLLKANPQYCPVLPMLSPRLNLRW